MPFTSAAALCYMQPYLLQIEVKCNIAVCLLSSFIHRPSSRPGGGSVHNTPTASRPATSSRSATGDVVRPPTRSGSRPVSQAGSGHSE